MRRLLWLCIPLLLAATPQPQPQPPVAARLGATLHLELPLPAGAVLVGLPDFGPFAARVPPQIKDNTLILELIPLRPGRYTFPDLPLQRGQEHLATEPLDIDVAAPPPPAAAHPLKAWPTATTSAPSPGGWAPGLAALAAGLLLLLLLLWQRRRPRSPAPAATPLDQLAARFAALRDQDSPRWVDFRARLLRLRFAPLSADPVDVAALAAEFASLQREES